MHHVLERVAAGERHRAAVQVARHHREIHTDHLRVRVGLERGHERSELRRRPHCVARPSSRVSECSPPNATARFLTKAFNANSILSVAAAPGYEREGQFNPIQFGGSGFATSGKAVPSALAAERAGFDVFHLTDSQCLRGDVYTQLMLGDKATRSIKLATGVTNPLTSSVGDGSRHHQHSGRAR